MKYPLILVFIILFEFSNVFSQENHIVDSLQIILKTQPRTETQISTLIALGDIYLHNTPDTSLYFFESALKLSVKEGAKKNIALCQRNIGSIYTNKSDYRNPTVCIGFIARSNTKYQRSN